MQWQINIDTCIQSHKSLKIILVKSWSPMTLLSIESSIFASSFYEYVKTGKHIQKVACSPITNNHKIPNTLKKYITSILPETKRPAVSKDHLSSAHIRASDT